MLRIFKVFGPVDLSRGSIEILEEFATSTHFRGFVAAAQFSPSFLNQLNPKLIFVTLNFGESENLFASFGSREREIIIYHDCSRLSINDKLDCITTSRIHFLSKEILPYSFAPFIFT